MIDLSIFYSNLATVGLIIFLGFILGKKRWIVEHTNRQLTEILLSIAMPAALFMAFPRKFDYSSFNDFLAGLIGGLFVFLTLIIMSRLMFRAKKLRSRVHAHQFAFIFNNASFLGYPLVYALFGETMLMAYCGFSVVFNIALFSYGIYLFEKKISRETIKKIVFNPNILAVLLGFVIFILPYDAVIPDFINNFLSYIGGIMTPLSLICIGYLLSRAKLSEIWQKKRLFITCGLQLTLGPILTLVVVSALGLPQHVKVMLVLLQSLPTATTLGLFSEKYGGDVVEAGEIVMVSTLMSVITLPIMSFVMNLI
ncbi:MAG: AEC family transporter [Candidatus Sacchiramonaceae bacterium]|nr:AEC family transporter [Candidatus Saccharimonadaceae bacterium]